MIRRGQLPMELMLVVFSVIVLASSVVSIYRFYAFDLVGDASSRQIAAYESFMLSVRRDAFRAVSATVAGNRVAFSDRDGVFAAYIYDSGRISRKSEPDNRSRQVLDGIAKVEFHLCPRTKGLVSVFAQPKDEMRLPFFTSFALRGGLR